MYKRHFGNWTHLNHYQDKYYMLRIITNILEMKNVRLSDSNMPVLPCNMAATQRGTA